MLVRREAATMLAATSCRNAVLKAAASSKVRGGASRVLVRPGNDAFAITATPHDDKGASPKGNGLVIGSLAALGHSSMIDAGNRSRRRHCNFYGPSAAWRTSNPFGVETVVVTS